MQKFTNEVLRVQRMPKEPTNAILTFGQALSVFLFVLNWPSVLK
jgi:hypothetical protein